LTETKAFSLSLSLSLSLSPQEPKSAEDFLAGIGTISVMLSLFFFPEIKSPQKKARVRRKKTIFPDRPLRQTIDAFEEGVRVK